MNINSIVEKLQNNLSKKRFAHSIGTADMAKELAFIYNGNQEKAYLAGLLHDCAKNLDNQQLLKILENEGYSTNFLQCTKILHAPVGAIIAKRDYNITDKGVLGAIKYHCYGKADMSLLEKIVFVADKIEINREFEDIEMLREIAKKDLDEALLNSLTFSVNNIMKKGYFLYKDTIKAKEYYEMVVEKKDNL